LQKIRAANLGERQGLIMQGNDLAERFTSALNELERTRNVQPVVGLFADKAVL
jgi:hypothetical protein